MAQSVQEHFWALERTLDRELSKHALALQLERKTGIKKTSLVGLALMAVVGLLALRMAADIIIALIAFVYPAIRTVTAIETHDKAEDTHWLSYWLVLGFWATVESATGSLLPSIIPAYPIVKLAAYVWLFLPQTRGATVVYEQVLRPLVLTVRDHPAVKQALSQVSRDASKLTETAKAKATDAAKRMAAAELSKDK